MPIIDNSNRSAYLFPEYIKKGICIPKYTIEAIEENIPELMNIVDKWLFDLDFWRMKPSKDFDNFFTNKYKELLVPRQMVSVFFRRYWILDTVVFEADMSSSFYIIHQKTFDKYLNMKSFIWRCNKKAEDNPTLNIRRTS